jgi:hypothetical protein
MVNSASPEGDFNHIFPLFGAMQHPAGELFLPQLERGKRFLSKDLRATLKNRAI